MRKCLFRNCCLIVFLILFSNSTFAQFPTCGSCHTESTIKNLVHLNKPLSSEERGLGIMDKGQVANYLGNYGVLSSFHEYFNDAIHWPTAANDETQYCFGLGLIVHTPDNLAKRLEWGDPYL